MSLDVQVLERLTDRNHPTVDAYVVSENSTTSFGQIFSKVPFYRRPVIQMEISGDFATLSGSTAPLNMTVCYIQFLG